MNLENARWRKTTDINRENAAFELVCGDEILLDVSFSDEGLFEIGFSLGIVNLLIEWSAFESIIQRGRELAESDKN